MPSAMLESIVDRYQDLSLEDLTSALAIHFSGPAPDKEEERSEAYLLAKPAIVHLFEKSPVQFERIAKKIKGQLGFSVMGIRKEIELLAIASGFSGANATPGTGFGMQQKISQATRLVELAKPITFFHTRDHEGWATIPIGNHQEHWAIYSKGFRRWLARQFYVEESKAPGSQAVRDALGVLEGKAFYEGLEQEVNVRVAEDNGNLYLDLANEAWQAVEISSSGWRPVDRPPVRFRRAKGMLPLPIPTRDGKIDDLWKFVNVRVEDRMLLLAWLLMSFSPRGPYPVLGLSGGQGTTKSTTARVLRALIDPSVAPVRTPPREERDLMVSANAGRVLAFDNLSHLPQWLSDAFCRLATGGGLSIREMYTNDEEMLFDAQRPVLFTSIVDIAVEGDLIDRGIRLILPQIPNNERKAEAVFWAEFEQARPSILGALLDVLVTILRRRASVTLKNLPRMADFVMWVAAGAPKLGWKVNKFLSAYESNRFTANQNTLDASTVAKGVLLLVQVSKWEGTASELLEKLGTLLTEKETKPKSWPKNPLALSNALRQLVPSLQTVGVLVDFGRSTGRNSRRTISISMEAQSSVASVASVALEEEPSEDTDFANDSREDFATLHEDRASQCDAPSVARDVGATQEASHCDAPPIGASAKKSNEINSADARDARDAEMHRHAKPSPLTDREVIE